MDAKSVVLLITGVIIISSVFTAFHVAYPSGNPIIDKIPKNVKLPQIFQKQALDKNQLGFGKTFFNSAGNATITIQGYAKNATGNSYIANTILYSAVFPVETSTYTSSTGFYQITVLAAGNGTFAFKIPGYNTIYHSLNLFGVSTVWQNLSFTPEPRYQVTGQTEFPSGNPVPNAGVKFTGPFSTFNITSDSNGFYSLNLTNGTYRIAAFKSGFSNQVTPFMVNVSGAALRNLTLTMHPYGNAIFNVSGYVFNELHQRISGAVVSSNSSAYTSTTGSSGFYSIRVAYGWNSIMGMAAGYMPNIPPLDIFVAANMTDQNITLQNYNPFSGTGLGGSNNNGQGTKTGQGLGGLNGSSSQNITNRLGNTSSNISYGNGPQSGGIVLYGNITNSADSYPVSDTNLRFYINVNGTYYYENVPTNGTGYYALYLQYAGTYHFSVYSPFYHLKNISLAIGGNTSYSFNMTPYSKYMLTISGSAVNAIDHLPVSAMIQLNSQPDNSSILYNYTNSNGHYNLYVMEGNYSITASSPGYDSETYNRSVTSDTVKDFNLTPSSSIGSGAQKWSGSSGTNLPGTNGTSISQKMNNTGSGNATGYKVVLLTITLYNQSNPSRTIGNKYYEAFIGIDGVIYNLTNRTDPSGVSVITLFYTGNYTILIDTVDYNGTPQKLDVTGNMSVDFSLIPKPLYTLEVTVSNAYPGPLSTNYSVPASTLSVTNYKTMGLSYESYARLSTGTIYTYVVPNGSYEFSYSNINYVPLAFQYNVSGSSHKLSQKADPYMAVVYVNSAANWSMSLTGPNTNIYESNTSGVHEIVFNLTQDTFTAKFLLSTGNILVYNPSFTLTNTKSIENLYFNISASDQTVSSSGITYNNTRNDLNISFNYSSQSEIYIYSMNVSSNYSTSPGFYINGNPVNTSTSYFAIKGNMSILFVTTPEYQTGYSFNLTIGYYTLTGSNSINFGVGT